MSCIPVNHKGKIFGRLTVIKQGPGGVSPGGHAYTQQWCRCECGNKKLVATGNLTRGTTKSCGCLANELLSKRVKTHGLSNSTEYMTWINMHQRCYNKNYDHYECYGERGIKICKRWYKSNPKGLENFVKDMGKKPIGYEIDRINNDKGYRKSNCHWVTPKQNQNNKRNNALFTFHGKTATLSQWADEYNIAYYNLQNRIYTYNWTFKKSILTPVKSGVSK